MNDSVYNINETFIIEGVTNDTPVISACTALYSNELFSCTGDTFIRLGTGAIYFNGDLYTNDNLSANTINASTYLSGGTNLFNIIQLTEITGGTYNSNSGVLSLKKGNDSSVNISGIHNYYTTGATLVGNVAYFNRNDVLSAYTLDLTTLIPPTPFDVFVTGGTYSNGAAVFRNNTGGTFTVSGFYTGATDVFVTGGTYSNGIATFTNNTGGTFSVSGFYTGFTGGFVSGLTATTISATTYQNLPLDIYTTGVTLNNSNYELTMTRNDGQTFGVNLGILSSDVTITGGSYNINTGVVTFTNNTGGTFSVSGFSSGMTDTSITNFTYNNNNFVITDSTGGTFNASINSVTGLTSDGTISSNVLSATTYQNLPIDVRVTGGTYSSGTAIFTNNTGGTFSVSGFSTGGTSSSVFTGGTVSGSTQFTNGLTANTFSATTYLGLPLDIRVTGGTYAAGTTTFTNNTGGTFNVSGFYTGFTGGSVSGLTATTISATTYLNLPIDIRVTGATKSGSVATFTNNTGGTFTLTGLSDVFVTGGTYSNGTAIFTNNTGGTFNVSGFSTGGTSSSTFTGGTVTGPTIFTNGLSANTISATTYLNLPLDIRVTGGTYNAGTATFINNTGGTFNVTGFSSSGTISGDYLPLSGGTVSGNTIFNSGLTVNYIDFDITPTIPNPTGGTLFFDSNENALSYKPITNQNDVTVNLGQESLIRVYNALPTTILNGQVLHITGATSGVPTVALANASKLGLTFTDSLAQSSGVATHDIPSGEYGFMTNFGVVRDLNTAAFTVGQEVFLSDTIDGALTNDPNNIAFTSRISTVGYCLESNATTGKILVVITNENALQSLTQQEINVLLGNTISTGTYFYTGATTASTTTINVSPMRGWIVYNTGPTYATNPLVLNIYYSGGTNIAVTGLTSSYDTYLLVNSGSTLYQTNVFPSPIERRENIFLGRVVHPNKTTILNVEQSVDYDVSPLSSLRDLWVPIKIINEGVVPSPNGATLTFKTSSGTFWGNGIGFPTNELNPNAITVPAYLPASFYYTTQTGGTFTATTTTVDTLNYDVGGVIVNVPGSGNYTTQRIYMSQSGVIRLQYGQNYYSTLAKAIAAIPSETFVVNPDNSIDCTLIGLLTVKDGAGDLSNTDDAVFTFVSKFGEILGGTAGISTTTLQQAYDNSVNPEIVTNSTLNGVQFKGGTGNDTDKNIIIENNSGVETGFISADGSSKFNTVSATTISATTYQNLPLDIRVTGGTFNNNNGIATFTNNTGGTFTVNNFPTTGTTLLWTAGTNTHSVAQLGGNNIASGAYSLAVGSGTTASGDYSYAGGNSTSAYTKSSFAIGIDSIASGSSITLSASPITIVSAITITLSDPVFASPAVVLNGDVVNEWQSYYDEFCSLFTIYSGSSSQTIDCTTGNKIYEDSGLTYIVDLSITRTSYDMISGDTFEYVNVSVPQPAFAIGYAVKAYGANSFAEGFATTASGGNSHAEGSGTIASGSSSHAEGYLTRAIGYTSHAEGNGTTAFGDNSHAEGVNTIASGNTSHAEGSYTKAIGNYSHAEGNNTTAVGTSSHAEGTNNIANGENSFAGGVDSVANGNISFVFGSGSTANGNSTIVLGNNITGTSDNTVYVPNVQFDLNAPSTMDVGRMEWNDVDGTVELGLKGGVVKTEIGQGLVTRVVNKTVPNIDLLASNYQVVVVSGAQGQRLAVKLAQADNDANSAGTLGLIAENINKNQEGFIITLGLLKNINTTGNLQGETWNDGDILYLSPTTAGAITNIKPQAPQHTVIIGYVEYSHPNNGKIYVKIDNGYELNELHNVRISAATNDQVLSFNSTLNVWENRTLPNFITGFTDTFVTGGTYNNSTGTAIFTNNTGGTFNVSGFTTGTTQPIAQFVTSISNGTAVTGTISNTLSKSLFVPANTLQAGSAAQLIARAAKTGNAGTIQLRLYWNTSPSLVGAILLATTTANASSSVFSQMSRWLPVEVADGTLNGTRMFTPTTFAASDFGVSTAAISTLALNWTVDSYLICAIQNGSSLDNSNCNLLVLK